ncbi:lipase chaperone LimK [Chitinivorax tropicus]|uniref:Lipase helper protein n=1 Tax=Chitinivorax tropicus TaxID=714531 RepID=A0A840MM07_9PROT|nr:lipase secretion chaperone [Chitinivorax tropicus]MBB5018515.1 lipase chaperone LimK [Chitinivorax tropicus]
MKTIWIGVATLAALGMGLAMTNQTDTVIAAGPHGQPTAPSKTNQFAASLTGTVKDGVIRQGQGELVVGPGLIQRFEYYLATLGEQPLSVIRHRIEQDMDQELLPEHALRGKQILVQYLEFKTALAERGKRARLESQALTFESAKARLMSIRQLRAHFFTPIDSYALFGEADQIDDIALAQMQVEQDASLSPVAKSQQLQALVDQLPANERAAQQAATSHAALAQKEAWARQQGASDTQIDALRTAEVGAEAAARLAKLDQEEAEWQRRIAGYRAERESILQIGLAAAQQQEALQRLRAQHFSDQEQLRLSAYEGG